MNTTQAEDFHSSRPSSSGAAVTSLFEIRKGMSGAGERWRVLLVFGGCCGGGGGGGGVVGRTWRSQWPPCLGRYVTTDCAARSV